MSNPQPLVSLIRAQIALILNRDGPYHVRGQFFPVGLDAEKQRHWQAEREVHEALRRLGCAWCHHPIEKDHRVTQVASRLIHTAPCLREFDEFACSGSRGETLTAQLKTSVELTADHEDQLVEWSEWRGDGENEKYVTELIALRELSSYERHTLELEDGRLVGGLPL